MKTLHLDAGEMEVVRNAVHMYLDSFGHDEAEVVESAKAVLRKLAEAVDDEVSEATQLIG
jgi:hypothetical protein